MLTRSMTTPQPTHWVILAVAGVSGCVLFIHLMTPSKLEKLETLTTVPSVASCMSPPLHWGRCVSCETVTSACECSAAVLTFLTLCSRGLWLCNHTIRRDCAQNMLLSTVRGQSKHTLTTDIPSLGFWVYSSWCGCHSIPLPCDHILVYFSQKLSRV